MHVCGLAHVASIIGVLARREYIFRLLLMKVLLALAVSCRSFVESAFLRTAWTLAFLGPCFVWGRRVFLRNLTGRIVSQASVREEVVSTALMSAVSLVNSLHLFYLCT